MRQEIKCKQCNKCKTIKPIVDFYNNRSRKDGRSLWCKKCTLQWSKKNRFRINKQHRDRYKINGDAIRKAMRERGKLPHIKEQRKRIHKKWRNKIRNKLLGLLGNKCMKCGITDFRVLQVDHINGNGNKERRIIASCHEYHLYIINKVLKGSKDYQLLCANCNWIKRYERNENAR